jgi:indolepyruvate ferredoxin oxidoreductase beta subunit
MDKVTNVLICGVGGQGILLASQVLSDVALLSGLDVRKSEVHGMAQRGGSVVSHVRLGPQVYSSLIKPGEADVVLAFEKLEGLRWLPYLAPSGAVVVNRQEIAPMSVIFGDAEYPQDTEERIRKGSRRALFIDGLAEAEKLGNPKVVNVILLGVLSKSLQFPEKTWHEALKGRVKPKFLELNEKAFARGRELAA